MRGAKRIIIPLLVIVLCFGNQFLLPVSAADTADIYSSGYKTLNPFSANAYSNVGCTWYAWGRAYEASGISLPVSRHAKDWHEDLSTIYPVGAEPKANSIAVWTDSGYGHVAFVEAVDSNYVYYTEGGWNGSNGGYAGCQYCHYATVQRSKMAVGSDTWGIGQTVVGYVYLTENTKSLEQVKQMFPDGKYWNHKVTSPENYGDYLYANGINTYADTWSDSPCTNHGIAAPTIGTYDCNVYDRAMQCYGYALRVENLLYGSNPREWNKTEYSALTVTDMQKGAIKAGDFITYFDSKNPETIYRTNSSNGHTAVVIDVNNTTLTLAEVNAGGTCQIQWGRTLDVTWLNNIRVNSAPYALEKTSDDIVPTGVTLNKSSASLTSNGATVTLTAKVLPNNATNKSVTWKTANAAVATVDTNGTVTAVGNGTTTITATTSVGAKTASCTVTVSIPTVSDGWTYVSSLPSNITTANYEIQYQNVYKKYAETSPGAGWSDTGEDKIDYVKSGSIYDSQLELATSNTVRSEGFYYYHFCSGSTGVNANFAQTSTYGHYDEIRDVTAVTEAGSYTDVDDARYKYYKLKWKDGTDAYCNTSKGTCDGTYGSHENRSYYWYKMYRYQNYAEAVSNLYQKTGDWGSAKDSAATAVNYRYKAKVVPTATPTPTPTAAPTPTPTTAPTPTPTPTTEPEQNIQVALSTTGIYMMSVDRDGFVAGLVTSVSPDADIEYRWTAYHTESQQSMVVKDWTTNDQWLTWKPEEFGEYTFTAEARVKGNPSNSVSATSEPVRYTPYIKGKCQMPYTGEGGGYLIGVETYENPNQSYQYEMLILDCTLLAEGKDAWVWTTGRYTVPEGNAGWCVWQPQYGYYWTLFRVYDADGNMIDQDCYGFVNAY